MMPGQVIGTPGAGLGASAKKWAANKGTAAYGKAAEELTGAIINHAVKQPGSPSALHHVMRPGSDADIDHIVVSGSDVYLLDSKCWKPGFYSRKDPSTRSSTWGPWASSEPAPHVPIVRRDEQHPAVHELQTWCAAHGAPQAIIHTMEYVVWPSKPGEKIRFARRNGANHIFVRSEASLTRFLERLTPANPDIVAALSPLVEN